MVYGASNLNGDLGKWYVAKGTDMRARSKPRFSKLEGESPTVSPPSPPPNPEARAGGRMSRRRKIDNEESVKNGNIGYGSGGNVVVS